MAQETGGTMGSRTDYSWNKAMSAVRAVAFAAISLMSLVAGCGWQSLPEKELAHQNSERFQITLGQDLILLPVRIGDTEQSFMLDTAATHHVFDVSLRSHLGESLGKGHTRDVEMSKLEHMMVQTPNVFVGNLSLGPSERSVVLDLTVLRQGSGEDIRGALGAPFLADRLIEIDFDQGVLSVSDRHNGKLPIGNPRKLTIDSQGCPRMDEVVIGRRTESFAISTGQWASVYVHKWLFDALIADGAIEEKGIQQWLTAAGPSSHRWGRLSVLSLGEGTHNDLVVLEGDANVIGLRLLERYAVTLNVSDSQIYLKPGRKFDQPDRVNQTGLHLKLVNGAILLAAADQGSPAEKAGLRQGDCPTRVNGTLTQRMRLWELKRILEESGGEVLHIEVQRDGKTIGAEFNVPQ
jgi:hypothetical protein